MATEVIADFEDPFLLKEEILSYPENKPEMLDFWAYIRQGVRTTIP